MLKLIALSSVGLPIITATTGFLSFPLLFMHVGIGLMYLGFGTFTTALHVRGLRTGNPIIEPRQTIFGMLFFFGLTLVVVVGSIERALS